MTHNVAMRLQGFALVIMEVSVLLSSNTIKVMVSVKVLV